MTPFVARDFYPCQQVEKAKMYKDKVKVVFDKRTKQNLFQMDGMVLR